MAGGQVEGTGSVWNRGNWMWEEKTYTSWAHKELRENLLTVAVEGDGVRAKIKEVSEIKGEASINIRKGKKVIIFDFTITAIWEARGMDAGEDEAAPVEGKVVMYDVMPDDVEDEDFEVHVSTTKGSGAVASGGRRLMGTDGTTAIKSIMKRFAAALVDRDGGERALEADRKRREEEEERQKKAQTAAQTAEKTETAEGSSSAAEAAAEEEGRVQGSAWNQNSYAWEEKTLTSWGQSRLKELLQDLTVDVEGSSVKIVNVEKCDGEVASSLRKGRKIIVYELSIVALWEGEIIGPDGEVEATGDGKININEWDQDTTPDEVEIPIEDAGTSVDERLGKIVREQLVPKIRQQLSTFVQELGEK